MKGCSFSLVTRKPWIAPSTMPAATMMSTASHHGSA
jgi:hypothetical protein